MKKCDCELCKFENPKISTAAIIIKDQKLILPKNSGTEIDPWPTDNDKEIVFWHFAGGNQPNKFDKLDTQFSKEVADYLKFLISDEQKT